MNMIEALFGDLLLVLTQQSLVRWCVALAASLWVWLIGDEDARLRKFYLLAPFVIAALVQLNDVVMPGGASGKLSVEDKVRPMPPVGMTFDPRSRISCQEVWTEVDGKPLSATFDGARLSVDFAKIAPRASNFSLEGKSVVGCKGLASVSASRGRTVLSR